MIKRIILILLLVFFSTSAFAKKGVNLFTYPREVPNTKIFNRYGQSFSLKDFAGDFLIVVFWSKTCVPCIREIADINEFIKKTDGTGVKLITVSPEKEWISPEEQQSFLQKNGKYYALPHYSVYQGLMYNIDLFEKKGLYFAKETDNGNDGFVVKGEEKSCGPDGVYGTSDDGLPSSYEEFFKLCDYMVQRGVTPFV